VKLQPVKLQPVKLQAVTLHQSSIRSTTARPRRRTSRRTTAGAVSLLFVVLAACGSSSKSTSASASAASATSTTQPAAATFPVTVAPANGSVTIPAKPVRILSLSATATQMLYAIGAGTQVAGVDKYSVDPPNAPKTAFDGTESAESYVSLHPDLVIVAFDTGNKLAAQLAALKIPALVLPPAKTVDDTYSQFALLGTATGHPTEASHEVDNVKQQLDAIVAQVGTKAKGLTYYHEVDSTLYTATSKTFIGALYGRLGMVNIADAADTATSGGYPQLSPEYLIKSDPDFVFLSDTECCKESAATFGARPGFNVMKAVKQGHIVPLSDAQASQWGPRVPDLLRTIADAVTKAPATTTTTTK
jgi:iron complex transport system substrate-binding protein